MSSKMERGGQDNRRRSGQGEHTRGRSGFKLEMQMCPENNGGARDVGTFGGGRHCITLTQTTRSFHGVFIFFGEALRTAGFSCGVFSV